MANSGVPPTIGVAHGAPTIHVAGLAVNRRAFDELTAEHALAMAESVFQGQRSAGIERAIEALSPQLAPEYLAAQRCQTPLVRFLSAAGAIKNWPREYRLRLEETLRYLYKGVPNLWTCPNFDIYYQTLGKDAVPAADAGGDILDPGTNNVVGHTTAGNKVPDYIERLCFWLERALETYVGPGVGFRNPAAKGKIQVTVSFAGNFQIGNMINIYPNWNANMLAAVATHEMMHVCQESYASAGNAGGWQWYWSMVEGGAVLSEDFVCDSQNEYIWHSTALGLSTLNDPAFRALDAPSNASRYDPYGFSLFLKYLCEQQSSRVTPQDRPTIGGEAYRRLFEWFDKLGYNSAAFEQGVRDLPFYQNFYQFDYLDADRLDELSSETLLGNFWLALYLKDLGVNQPDRRFYFMENLDDVSFVEDFLNVDSVERMGPVGLTSTNDLMAGGSLTLSTGHQYDLVPEFAAQLHKVRIAPEVDTLRVDFTADMMFTRPLVEIVLIDPGGVVRDILRSDRMNWARTIANERAGVKLDHILIVAAGTDIGGPFTLTVKEVAPAPDVMVTRWHHKAGTHYEIDSFDWAWTWVSPDVWIDNNADGQADPAFFNEDNQLFVRLRNQGHVDASGIGVEFWYQPATTPLKDGAWQPVKNLAGAVQKLAGLNLAAGGTAEWPVSWAPPKTGAFAMRVLVTAPGDPNTDNKRCMSNFGVLPAIRLGDIQWDRRFPVGYPVHVKSRIDVIPRTGGMWFLSAADLVYAESLQLEPGESVSDAFRIREYRMDGNAISAHSHSQRGSRLETRPNPYGNYRTDPDALPPGFAGMGLITLAYVLNGRPVGGFTWAIQQASDG